MVRASGWLPEGQNPSRAEPWVRLGRGKPRPYIRDIDGELFGP
jgi:hypothetical protein